MPHEKHPANFMQCLAPTNIQGTSLESNDQCAMAIRFRRQDERRQEQKSNVGYSNSMAIPARDWFQEHRILERGMQAKTQRGGMTMRTEDGLINPPRGKYPETMRDTGTAA